MQLLTETEYTFVLKKFSCFRNDPPQSSYELINKVSDNGRVQVFNVLNKSNHKNYTMILIVTDSIEEKVQVYNEVALLKTNDY